jgi:hypothetical protein
MAVDQPYGPQISETKEPLGWINDMKSLGIGKLSVPSTNKYSLRDEHISGSNILCAARILITSNSS